MGLACHACLCVARAQTHLTLPLPPYAYVNPSSFHRAQCKDGKVYEGVLHLLTADASSGLRVVLRFAKVIKDPAAADGGAAQLAVKPQKEVVIDGSDLVQMVARDVRTRGVDVGPIISEDAYFGTDAAIGRGRGGCVRCDGRASGVREAPMLACAAWDAWGGASHLPPAI